MRGALYLALVGWLALGAGAGWAADLEEEDEDDEEEEVIPATPCARTAYEDEETPLPRAVRIDRESGCLVVGGELRAGHQWLGQKGGGGLIGLSTPGGLLLPANRAFAFSAALKLEWHAFTEAGRLGLITETGWQKTEGDGLGGGLLQLRKAYVRFGGLRFGFGDSYANFFDPQLLSTAYAPKRSVGFIGYEWTFNDVTRFALAAETGAVFGSAQQRFIPIGNDTKPFYLARFQHDFETFEVHAAAVYTLRDRVNPVSGATSTTPGYALTLGARFDVPAFGTKDDYAFQVTYARNAPAYLGAAIDLGNLGPQLAAFAQSSAFSGITSYTRKWTGQWSSTAFAGGSVLQTPGTLNTRAASVRYGANLVYEPVPGLKIGIEGARQESRLDRDPVFGVRPGQKSRATGQTLIIGATGSF